MNLTEGRGIDHVFVTVGAKAAFDGAFSWMGRFGQLVVVGMPPSGVMAEYDPGTMAAWNQRILGSKMGEATIAVDIPMLVELYRAGRLKLDELVTRTYRLDRDQRGHRRREGRPRAAQRHRLRLKTNPRGNAHEDHRREDLGPSAIRRRASAGATSSS